MQTAKSGEAPDGRLVSHLLTNPTEDGGQWDMLVNVIKKYGVMPKKCWNEAWSCESTRRLNTILKTKVWNYGNRLHKTDDY